MNDRECVELLRWALPELGLRWKGFSNVRGQVKKRLARRIAALGLDSATAYQARLEADPAEWQKLEALCRVTITRFYRDRGMFEALEADVLPELVRAARERGRSTLRAWSAGCCGGEEPYSLALLWRYRVAPALGGLGLHVIATDADPEQLARAARGSYARSTLRDLPLDLLERGFRVEDQRWLVCDEVRSDVELVEQDLRAEQPAGPFDLVLCRNLAFTYFDHDWQLRVAEAIRDRLGVGGVLVIGKHEHLPEGFDGLSPLRAHDGIFEKG